MIGIMEIVVTTPVITLLIGFVLLFLTAFFVAVFLARALFLVARLGRVVSSLKGIKNATQQTLKNVSGEDVTLAHLWHEYADTLHRQQEHGAGGKQPVDTLWSTVPASSIFTTEAIVDARLWTEFFKHLPGIFTGLGIIGTFSGLIRGLQAFQVSADPNVVRGGLEGLMHRVGDAFVVSAIAIGLAMFTTLVERIFVTYLYKQVEEMTAKIDGFFHSGVGEEYLSRLTRASEESAGQSKILKDALVGDLERILTQLTESQIAAQGVGMQKLGEQVAKGVADTLAGPLDALARTAQRNSESNAEAVTQLLTDVLAGFSQRLEDLFGGQIGGINKLQQQTIDALSAAVAKLTEMATTVEAAGAKSADALNERLLAALKDMEAHQKAANERMAAFVDQLRGAVDQSQSETNRKLQETLGQVGIAVEAQIAALRDQAKRSSAAQAERDGAVTARTDEMLRTLGASVDEVLGSLKTHLERSSEAQVDRDRRAAANADDSIARLSAAVEAQLKNLRDQGETSTAAQAERDVAVAARTEEMVGQLGTKVDEVLGAMRAHLDRSAGSQNEREQRLAAQTAETVGKLSTVAEMLMSEVRVVTAEVRTAVDAMRGVTTTAIDKMNSGSENLYLAASEFKTAGLSVAGAFQQAEGLSNGLRLAAGSVSEASASLQGVVADHASARDTLAKMLEEMRGIVENARREAGVATDVIARIEAASQGLGQAHKQAEDYLNEVTRILATTHERYATSLASALGDQYKAFYTRLSEATGLLQAAIQELAVTVQPSVKRAAE
jgi:hypothetical protein